MRRTEKTRWRWFTNHMLELAKKLMKEYEVIPMTFMLLTDDNDDYRTYFFPIESEAHKAKVFEYMCKVMNVHQAIGISIIAETWVSKQEQGETYVQPRFAKDRVDGLIHYTRIGDKKQYKMYEVKKDRSLEYIRQVDEMTESKFDLIYEKSRQLKVPLVPEYMRESLVERLGKEMGLYQQALDLKGKQT